MPEDKEELSYDELAEEIRSLRAKISKSAKRRKGRGAAPRSGGGLTVEQRELLTAIREKLDQERQKEAQRQEQELLEEAIRWVESKWGSQPCPYCQQVKWQVGTPLELSALNGEVMSPAFPVMCGNCGHTTFVNAIKAGLLSDEESQE